MNHAIQLVLLLIPELHAKQVGIFGTRHHYDEL